MLKVVGMGPGELRAASSEAVAAVEEAQVVVGYSTYLRPLGRLLEGREVVASSMMKEVERCRIALERAAAGERVALISGGDAGIYGMAGLVLELCRERGLVPGRHLSLEVIPGIPALSAGAALLGAPLMHDFAVVSLSDLLTPWEVIERRIEGAAAADFVLVIYNPRSRRRQWQLGRAREVILRHRSPETPVGMVKRAYREGQEVVVSSLAELPEEAVDMQTILFVGNSRSWSWQGLMVTPRGYGDKYRL